MSVVTDGYLLTTSVFRRWVAIAAIGNQLVYHEGYLACDRAPEIPTAESRRLHKVAQVIMNAAEDGRVHLVQRRLGEGRFAYIAVRAFNT